MFTAEGKVGELEDRVRQVNVLGTGLPTGRAGYTVKIGNVVPKAHVRESD